MNIFELAWAASPVIGAVVGVRNHAAVGVSAVWGGVLGAVGGVAVYFAFIFAIAIVMCLCTGESLFPPKKERADNRPNPVPDKGK